MALDLRRSPGTPSVKGQSPAEMRLGQAHYLGTLLEAATGEAKVVVTSRTQHFSDDSQIRRALVSSRDGRQSTRIVTLEDFSEPQIRMFLSRLYGGAEARAARRFDRLRDIKDLLGLSGNPRMLAFIAELPDDELDEARSSGSTIRAADLYAKILDRWLRGEVSRQRLRLGPEPLPEEHRRTACRELALRLWAAQNAGGGTVGLPELGETVVAALTELETLGFSCDQVVHTIGSGSLLTRTSQGFGFVHQSIMEWLVADAMATAVRSGRPAPELAMSQMSDLMTDFFCDRCGPSVARSWADGVLRRGSSPGAEGVGRPRREERANATRVRARLSRRADLEVADFGDPAPHADETLPPLDLSGQDLRDQDLAALSGHRDQGGPRGLQGAVLRDTTWTGRGLTGLDLTGADLARSALDRTRLVNVDLTRAHLGGARLVGAQLSQVSLRGADLRGADLSRALLKDVDLRGAALAGSTWHRTALLGGRYDAGFDRSAEEPTLAVAGKDLATPVLAASGFVSAMAYLVEQDLLAVARGNSVELVDPETQAALRVLTGHTDQVVAVAAVPLPDGRVLLATGSHDRTVRLWDPATGTPAGQPLTGHTDSVCGGGCGVVARRAGPAGHRQPGRVGAVVGSGYRDPRRPAPDRPHRRRGGGGCGVVARRAGPAGHRQPGRVGAVVGSGYRDPVGRPLTGHTRRCAGGGGGAAA